MDYHRLFVTRPAKINHLSTKIANFLCLCSIITLLFILLKHTAEFNGLSSTTYGNGIPQLKRKILVKIQLGVTWLIFTGLVTFHDPFQYIHSQTKSNLAG